VFRTSTVASLAGLYRFRLRASGTTLRGRSFDRDMLLTTGVHAGGDQPAPGGGPRDGHERLCRLLHCLLTDGVLGKRLRESGVDLERLRRCLQEFCRGAGSSARPASALMAALSAAGLDLHADLLSQLAERLVDR